MPARKPPMKQPALILSALLTVLAGCASSPAVVSSTKTTAFEQLRIKTSVGSVQGYLYKPQDAAVRFMVALQSSPCPSGDDREISPMLDTDGAILERFKYDSVFFQFERPEVLSDSHSVVVVCERAERTADDWQQAIVDSLDAVRKRENLEGVPTTYLGIGKGAKLALSTALADPESKSIVLMSAVLAPSDIEQMTQLLAHTKGKRKPSILFVHGEDDTRTTSAQILRMSDMLSAQHIQTKLILVDEVGADFDSGASADCFEFVAARLSDYVRFDQPAFKRVRVECRRGAPDART